MNTAPNDAEFIRQRNRGRLKLILLAVLFIGPLLAAFGLYYGNFWKPTGSAVHGLLLTPPIQLPTEALLSGADTPRFLDSWSLLVVAPGSCSESCQKALLESRQVRKALGSERDRVQRIWLVSEGIANARFITEQHPLLHVVPSNEPRLTKLLALIGEAQPGEVMVVDPLGNLMMRFPPDTSMRAMHTDLKKLLKLSRIG